MNENASAALKYHQTAISEDKKAVSQYMTPDGYPIYNAIGNTNFAAVHYAINIAQTNDPRSKAVLRILGVFSK